jgi:hypothetical protein
MEYGRSMNWVLSQVGFYGLLLTGTDCNQYFDTLEFENRLRTWGNWLF